MLLSIILPCRNEEKYIKDAIDSVYRTSLPESEFELIIVDGESEDSTVEIVEKYMSKYRNLQLVRNKYQTVPYAMNMGIKKSSGKYIVRLDAHCIYPEDYFEKLLEWHKKLDADNIGGIIISKTKEINRVSSAITAVLSDKFGVGNSYFRIGVNTVKEVDTVPFGCFKREVFDKYGLYDVRLKRSQDIELNHRIIEGGGRIFLIPEIKIIYFARESYKALFEKYFENGKWNIFVAFYTKKLRSLSMRSFIPAVFVLSVLLSLGISFFQRIFLLIPLVYSFIISSRSIFLSYKLKVSFPHTALAFIVLHFSHGMGALSGVLSLLNPRHWKIRGKGRLE